MYKAPEDHAISSYVRQAPGLFQRLVINMHGNQISEVLLKTDKAVGIQNQYPLSVNMRDTFSSNILPSIRADPRI